MKLLVVSPVNAFANDDRMSDRGHLLKKHFKYAAFTFIIDYWVLTVNNTIQVY